MSVSATKNSPLIRQLLALLADQSLCSYYDDLGLPIDIATKPMPLRVRAIFALTQISSLQGDFFQMLQTTNELFQDFLAKLSCDYYSEIVHHFNNWVNRHGIDHEYHVGLSFWHLILCRFDGYVPVSHSEDELTGKLAGAFAIYHRLLSSNDKLSRSWFNRKLVSIQNCLEVNQSLGIREPFLEIYSLSQQMLFIEEILAIERSYRFLDDLKQHGEDVEKNQFIECARELGAESEWPPSMIAHLKMSFEKD